MAGVVFHLNEADPVKHQMVIRNMRNVKQEMPDLFVELVVHGPGINLAVVDKSTLFEEVKDLLAHGVRIAVCQNTMTAQHITPEQLLPGMTVVPAGIAEIIQRQQEGFSYVKP